MFDQQFINALVSGVVTELEKRRSERRMWPELMTIETAAEYMDRTPTALRLLLQKSPGLLPCTKLDGRLQFRKLDLDRLFERKTG